MNIKGIIKNLYGTIFFYFFRIFPIDNNKIFFSSLVGKGYEGNARYISEYLLEKRKDIKQVWASRPNNKFEISDEVKKTNWGTLQMIYEMATSKVWVDTQNIQTWIKKRNGQIFIQTWHGGLGVKKIAKDSSGELSSDYKKMIEHTATIANLFISNSTHLTNIYRQAFKWKGEIAETGFPKNDIFFSSLDKKNEIRKKVFNKLNIDENKNIVLYAPTFREDNNLDVYNIDFTLIKNALETKLKRDFVVLFRLHPKIRNLSENLKEKNKGCIDASYYDDMQELIIATDVFITDYSSGIFDFACLRRPGFLFATDIEEYEKERGLYYDLRTMPFPLAKSNNELENNILNFDIEEYRNKLEKFFKDMNLRDNANSTEKVAKIIEDYIDGKRK